MCVLAATGRIPPVTAALFCNVGDDSEHPKTLRFVREVMSPWCKDRGLDVIELGRIKKTGEPETLMGRLTRHGSRSLPIPVRMSNGAPGTRSCTMDFKVRVIGKWLRSHGATATQKASVLIGISLDEMQRVGNRKTEKYEEVEYPLLDLRLTRDDCKKIISEAGLPVPPKSSCFFCPFHRPAHWSKMRRDEPDLFDESQKLEDLLNERRSALGKDPVWLTRFNRRLSEAIQPEQPTLFDDSPDVDRCDSGHCWV